MVGQVVQYPCSPEHSDNTNYYHSITTTTTTNNNNNNENTNKSNNIGAVVRQVAQNISSPDHGDDINNS